MFIKRIIKNIFSLLGVEVKRISSRVDLNSLANTRKTMKESLQHLNKLGFYPKTVVDVGAAFGTMEILDVFPKSEHILIEPLVEYEPFLLKLQKQYNLKYILAGAGKQKGKITINVHQDLQGSSIFKEKDGESADGSPRTIDLITLDVLLDMFQISDNVLLKIDVQGAELDVLEGGKSFLNSCEAIILEVSFFKFLHGMPDFYDIVYFMKQIGFVAYDIFDGLNRPLDNALAQKDILFVKENGRFRKSHNWGNKK